MCEVDGLSRVQNFLLHTLKPSTITKYTEALQLLNNELLSQQVVWSDLTEEDQDNFLAEWLISGYEKGHGKTQYAWALSAVQKIFPRARYRVCWKVYDAWQVLQPAHQAPASPPELLQAMVVMSLCLNKPQLSLVMLLSYVGLLRVREALQLKVNDVVLSPASVVLCLGITKRGMEQKVVLTHPGVVAWVSQYFSRFGPQKSDAPMFDLSYSTVLRWVRKLADCLGAAQLNLSTHSFRRSGASELARQGMPLQDILLYGRWLSERAARDYIRKGEVAVLRARGIISQGSWDRINKWLDLVSCAWVIYDQFFIQEDLHIDVSKLTSDRMMLLERHIFTLFACKTLQ